MNKSISKIVLIMSMALMGPAVSYGVGGAAGAHAGRIQAVIAAGASGTYASTNAAQCGWRSPMPCIRAAMGIMQLIQMLQGARNSGMAASALINGAYDEFGFDPTAAGFCMDSTSGCTPDGIDTALSGFEDAFTTGEGYEAAIDAMESDALAKLSAIEAKGFKVDTKAGTITDPSGKVTKFSDVKTSIPKSLSKAASSKLAGIQAALAGKTSAKASKRGVASAGGAGGVIFKDEYIGGGLGGSFGKKAKSKKDNKGEFLAGLSDKDAKKGGVGFAGDDIFNMIQRRYTKKLKAKEFIGK
ncbi:MAG: hypothetical protein ACRBBP_07350 [Bdellovibrionales bacterium]